MIRRLLVLAVLVSVCLPALTGCGGSTPTKAQAPTGETKKGEAVGGGKPKENPAQ